MITGIEWSRINLLDCKPHAVAVILEDVEGAQKVQVSLVKPLLVRRVFNAISLCVSLNTPHGVTDNDYDVNILNDSVKFYLPRVEGYLEIVREMASKYKGMSLVEFDGYFEGKFEPVK